MSGETRVIGMWRKRSEGSGKRPSKGEGDGSVGEEDLWKGNACSLKTTCRVM